MLEMVSTSSRHGFDNLTLYFKDISHGQIEWFRVSWSVEEDHHIQGKWESELNISHWITEKWDFLTFSDHQLTVFSLIRRFSSAPTSHEQERCHWVSWGTRSWPQVDHQPDTNLFYWSTIDINRYTFMCSVHRKYPKVVESARPAQQKESPLTTGDLFSMPSLNSPSIPRSSNPLDAVVWTFALCVMFRYESQRRDAQLDGSALRRLLWSHDAGELHQPDPSPGMHVQ